MDPLGVEGDGHVAVGFLWIKIDPTKKRHLFISSVWLKLWELSKSWSQLVAMVFYRDHIGLSLKGYCSFTRSLDHSSCRGGIECRTKLLQLALML